MFAAGFFAIVLAVFLAESARKNRSPIATLEAIVKDPKNARTVLTTSQGTLTPNTGILSKAGGHTGPITNPNPTGVSASSSPVAAAACAYAEAQIGKPYRYGATGPDAYDCSGLIYAAYKSAGMTIPRTTAGQIIGGKSVPKAELQPGDLVFPYPGHVFLYVNGGQCVEAPHTGTAIHWTNIYSFFTARRYA